MLGSTFTLITVTPHTIARVDVTTGKRIHVRSMTSTPRSSADATTLKAAVQCGLKLSKRKARKVCVLSTEMWTDIVHLPDDIKATLEGAELQQALALEAELASELPAFESRVAYWQLEDNNDGEGRWWTVQIANSELESIKNLAEQSGGCLIGFAHPGAATMMTSECRQVEHVREALEHWASEDIHHFFEQVEDKIPAEVNAWATDWNRVLFELAEDDSAPVIRLEVPVWNKGQQIRSAIAMTIMSAAVCGAIHHWNTNRLSKIRTSISDLETEQRERAQVQKSHTELTTKLNSLNKELKVVRNNRENLEESLQLATTVRSMESARWVVLMDGICDAVDSDCWLQKIESTAHETRLIGVTTDNAAAHRFASQLETALTGSVWQVLPAETQADGIGLIRFTVVLNVAQTKGPDGTVSNEKVSNLIKALRSIKSVQIANSGEENLP